MNQSVLDILRSEQFLNYFVKRTELACSKTFWRLCERKQSFRSVIKGTEDAKAQLTRSNRISVRVGEEFEEEICPALRNCHVRCKHIDNAIGDISIQGQIWEIKTSKHNPDIKSKTYSLQGATHSSSKTSSYIFIRYELDFDKRLRFKSKPNNIIKGLHFSVHNGIVLPEYWHGEANGSNSRTTLQVPKEVFDDFQHGVIYGSLRAARKYLQFHTAPFNLTEYTRRVNALPDILGIK